MLLFQVHLAFYLKETEKREIITLLFKADWQETSTKIAFKIFSGTSMIHD